MPRIAATMKITALMKILRSLSSFNAAYCSDNENKLKYDEKSTCFDSFNAAYCSDNENTKQNETVIPYKVKFQCRVLQRK